MSKVRVTNEMQLLNCNTGTQKAMMYSLKIIRENATLLRIQFN
jgi:hypothetical protein